MALPARLSGFLQLWRRGPTKDAPEAGSLDDVPGTAAVEDATESAEAPEAGPDIAAAVAIAEPQPSAAPALMVEIIAHIENLGDRKAGDGGWAGQAAGSNRIEGFRLTVDAPAWNDRLSYQSVLADRSLAPLCRSGSYCGTRGRTTPLHGFVIHLDRGAGDNIDFTYEGIFADGFRSGPLSSGQICTSPEMAALVRMRAGPGMVPAPEDMQPAENDRPVPVFSLIAHIQTRGDTARGKDGWVGVPASQRAIEGFALSSPEPDWNSAISYQAVSRDGTCAPPVAGGGFCGTRGKMTAIFGFVLNVAEQPQHVRMLTYEGAFADGFRSARLSPGTLCVSPSNAPLVAMRVISAASDDDTIAATSEDAATVPENVRLVVWDLDECFWGGTLSEGGVVWNETHAQIVRALARRGIPSTICSKNDPAPVLTVLEQHGMRDYFVFPSISWEPKGPRLADLVTAVQLRAETLLFIDDNAMNRAEANRFVPGLQVQSEACIPTLLENPRLSGNPDPNMQRLAQYRLLERRHVDAATAGGDTTAFLRDSNIVVVIEHDLEPHLDRAIELINRTNQLNFTKKRLPENLADARRELRDLLAQHDVQGAILRVRDKYGDYGYCGIYIMIANPHFRTLLHFAFSCRILGMGVERWLYRTIGRPTLDVKGDVVGEVFDESRDIDWIHTELPGLGAARAASEIRFDYIFARGGCELFALSHYFAPLAGRVIDELAVVRGGQQALVNHSLIGLQSMRGIDPRAFPDFRRCGFEPEDFKTFLASDIPSGPALWLLNFTVEEWVPYYRHKETGALLPMIPANLGTASAEVMRGNDTHGADRALIAHLREKFDFAGRVPIALFGEALESIFARAPQNARVFVLLANTVRHNADGSVGVIDGMRVHNKRVADAAQRFPNILLVSPEPFMSEKDEYASMHDQHFDRMVYFRIFQHIMKVIADS